MGDEENILCEKRVPVLVESWPNLTLLGLGIWWGWVWLCFSSMQLSQFFPEAHQTQDVLVLYLVSTLAISGCMLVAIFCWKKITPLLDRRAFVVVFGIVAALSTLCLYCSAILCSNILFWIGAVLTGIGTSIISLKVGSVYGAAPLGDSLVAGNISLVLAASIYFIGIGLPNSISPYFIAVLPLLAALLLTIPWGDPYPPVFHGSSETLGFAAPERKMMRKISGAVAAVAFTSGIGKGVSSVSMTSDQFAESGVVAMFLIVTIAVIVILLINRARSAHGIRMIYTALMVAGILEMLATSFGYNIFYLQVGKEVLWLMLMCFIAYLVFKYDFSAVRSFGVAQLVYFLSSVIGWGVGGAIAPFYVDATVRTAVGIILACMVMFVLLFVLTEEDIHSMVNRSYQGQPDMLSGGVAITMPVAKVFQQESSVAQDAQEARAFVTDDLQRARDPKYGLSKRELEVLGLFAQGRSAAWIADNLIISKNTARSHLRNIYAKLDVHSRQELLDFLAGE